MTDNLEQYLTALAEALAADLDLASDTELPLLDYIDSLQ